MGDFAFDLDELLDEAVLVGALASGRDPALAANQFGAARVIASAGAVDGQRQVSAANAWTPDEDAFLRQWAGLASADEIAAELGRSPHAVDTRRIALGLPSPLRHPDYITGQGMSQALGVDGKSIRLLIERGLLKAELAPLREGKAWRMRRTAFYAWATNPMNWPYFIRSVRRPERIADEHLRRLIMRRAREWGDEWWEIGRVARYHGVHQVDVNRYLHEGWLAGVQWGNWWVRRSEATRPSLRFRNYATGRFERTGTPAGDAFLLLAAAVGIPLEQIGRMMGRGRGTARSRLDAIHGHGRAPWLIRAYELPVLYRAADNALWADWRPLACRFPRLARAWARSQTGRPWTRAEVAERLLVSNVLAAWARWHGADANLVARLVKGELAAMSEAAGQWEEWASRGNNG